MPSSTNDIWWYEGAYGEKGSIRNEHFFYSRYSKSYGTDDVVGCGWIRSGGEIFFTLNGVNQGNQGNHSSKISLTKLFRRGIHKRAGNFAPVRFHIWYTEG